MPTHVFTLEIDDPHRPDVTALLAEHLADMHGTSPAESVHALDVDSLTQPGIAFWTAREDGVLLGCGALKKIDGGSSEIKSMRTTPAARGRGVGASMLAHIIEQARATGVQTLFLETGSDKFFSPARRLYERHGFQEGPPFADYIEDPYSVFMQLDLTAK